jgi:hypothetical protein
MAERREPVAEAAVDRLLRRPERRDRLAALADVAQLRVHHPPQQAAPRCDGRTPTTVTPAHGSGPRERVSSNG